MPAEVTSEVTTVILYSISEAPSPLKLFLNYLTRSYTRSKSEYRKQNLNMLECYMEQANIEKK